MDFIAETIEQSRTRFNPRLTVICIQLIKSLEKKPPPDRKCWRFMQMLFMISKALPCNLQNRVQRGKKAPGFSRGECQYWGRCGIVVDPTSLTQQTAGIIRFRWDDECYECDIKDECNCEGKPKIDER